MPCFWRLSVFPKHAGDDLQGRILIFIFASLFLLTVADCCIIIHILLLSTMCRIDGRLPLLEIPSRDFRLLFTTRRKSLPISVEGFAIFWVLMGWELGERQWCHHQCKGSGWKFNLMNWKGGRVPGGGFVVRGGRKVPVKLGGAIWFGWEGMARRRFGGTYL